MEMSRNENKIVAGGFVTDSVQTVFSDILLNFQFKYFRKESNKRKQ